MDKPSNCLTVSAEVFDFFPREVYVEFVSQVQEIVIGRKLVVFLKQKKAQRVVGCEIRVWPIHSPLEQFEQ